MKILDYNIFYSKSLVSESIIPAILGSFWEAFGNTKLLKFDRLAFGAK
ncbi:MULTISPECIES: hypothetical protein [unclassified Helicobacter]|nr:MULTISPECIES: hypothetical protein [unclassified Helicobacter]